MSSLDEALFGPDFNYINLIDKAEIIKRFYLSNSDYSALYFIMQQNKVRTYCLNYGGKEYFEPKDVKEWILYIRKIQNRNSDTASYHQRGQIEYIKTHMDITQTVMFTWES